MRIIANGKVGIGTTNPLNTLQVVGGSIGIDSEFAIRDNRNNTLIRQSPNTSVSNRTLTIGNATYSNIIMPNGNIGIGTTSPNAKLTVKGSLLASEDLFHIEDSGGVRMIEVTSDPVGNASLQVKDTSGSTKGLINSAGNSYLVGGNVGIGTTAPQATLDVNGPIRVGTAPTVAATSANVGSIRYRAGSNNSYMEMVMQTGAGVADFAWVIIKQNTW